MQLSDASIDAVLTRELADVPRPLGVAVSGGGDSVALLHLLHRAGVACHAVTLNHGLRPEAADEAAMVGAMCAGLGVTHDVLHWQDRDGRGNLMAAARDARLRLIGGWARGRGLRSVALGHTADDLAETFLLRLARGSGVDGLSAMAARREAEGVIWLRPLLTVPRSALRAYLIRRGVTWAEDPTNANPAYDRTRARAALVALDPLGIGVRKLAATAGRMSRARAALERATADLACAAARIEAGDVLIDRAALSDAPEEIALRLLAHAVRWVTPASYRPRLAPLEAALEAVLSGRRATVGGALLAPRAGALRVGREPRGALGAHPVARGEVWDARWRLWSDQIGEVRALGAEGLDQCHEARATGLPRNTLIASPALWDGARLLAAPLARHPGAARLEAARDASTFAVTILSH